jgi:hypothetical protein
MSAMPRYLAFTDVLDCPAQGGNEFGQWRIRCVGSARGIQPNAASAKSAVLALRQKRIVMARIHAVAEVYIPFDQPPGILQR